VRVDRIGTQAYVLAAMALVGIVIGAVRDEVRLTPAGVAARSRGRLSIYAVKCAVRELAERGHIKAQWQRDGGWIVSLILWGDTQAELNRRLAEIME
jgi:hypothetical protein